VVLLGAFLCFLCAEERFRVWCFGDLFFQNFALESLYGVCDEGAIFYSDSSTLSDNNCVGVFSVCRS
jgi:hypothetical protein